MRKVLVLGGTRFFGKRLVERLLGDGRTEVTILTRGRTPDPFGEAVTRLEADRTRTDELLRLMDGSHWDVVYDNICYKPDEAVDAVKVWGTRASRYILTSSLSVYDPKPEALSERDFDPYNYPYRLGEGHLLDYQEGKRMAEAALLREAPLPVAAVRFPIVLGPDDYTRRLHFHIEHVRRGQPIGLSHPEALMCFISSAEAADFLYALGDSRLTGPVNACSDGAIRLSDLMEMIGNAAGTEPIVRPETEEEHRSPFGIEGNWYMDNRRAKAAGLPSRALADWLPDLVSELNTAMKKPEGS